MKTRHSILAAVLLIAGCLFLTTSAAHASTEAPPASPPTENTPEPVRPDVAQTKAWRKEIDEIITNINKSERRSRPRSLVLTKLEEAVMWLGKDLADIDRQSPGSAPNPYPESKNPASDKVEPPADNLKN